MGRRSTSIASSTSPAPCSAPGSAHLLVADYALRTFRQLGPDGPVGEPRSLEGTLAGRAFGTGELAEGGTDPTLVCIPLSDHGDRIGVLELEVDQWGDEQAAAGGTGPGAAPASSS